MNLDLMQELIEKARTARRQVQALEIAHQRAQVEMHAVGTALANRREALAGIEAHIKAGV